MNRSKAATKSARVPGVNILFPASIEGVIVLALTAAAKGDLSLSNHLLQWGESKGFLKSPNNVIPPDLLAMLQAIVPR